SSVIRPPGGQRRRKTEEAGAHHAPAACEIPDSDLLARYVAHDCQQSFRQLVDKYQQLVLGAAYRRTGDMQLAKEDAQRVFAILARKGRLLMGRSSIAGWLHQASVYEA